VLTARNAAGRRRGGAFLANAHVVVAKDHLVWSATVVGVERARSGEQAERYPERRQATPTLAPVERSRALIVRSACDRSRATPPGAATRAGLAGPSGFAPKWISHLSR
jgi:hypothetical protein